MSDLATLLASEAFALKDDLVAALAAITIASVGSVSDTTIVATVAVVAFAASWVQTGRLQRSAAAPANMLSPG